MLATKTGLRMQFSAEQCKAVVVRLSEIARSDKAYSSDAALARALGIPRQKLSRWKTGAYSPSPEIVSLFLLLISLGSGAAIKQALEQRKDVLKSLEIGD